MDLHYQKITLWSAYSLFVWIKNHNSGPRSSIAHLSQFKSRYFSYTNHNSVSMLQHCHYLMIFHLKHRLVCAGLRSLIFFLKHFLFPVSEVLIKTFHERLDVISYKSNIGLYKPRTQQCILLSKDFRSASLSTY